MKYYKIIQDSTFIGAVNSGAFLVQRNNRLYYSDETLGQYISYEGMLYHDYWMQPVDNSRPFTIASIQEITESEYNTIMEAIHNNEEIVIDDDEPEEEPIPQPENPEDPDEVLEFLRAQKLRELSNTCRRTIENGFDLELRGETRHFSLDTQDQLNLISLSGMAQTQSLIPYHADGEQCIFYTNEEINQIVETATAFKIYHTTYYNALKGYVNALDSQEAITSISYGAVIPDEYKSDVLKALEG